MEFFAPDIFFITRPIKRRASPKPWVAVFPCGSEFELCFEGRGEWSCPVYKEGEQTQITVCADTRSELAAEMVSDYDCTIQKGYSS